MKLRHVLGTILLGAAAFSPLQAQTYSGPVAANAYITQGGLDWAWASPCYYPGGCSSIVLSDTWRFATTGEWAGRPALDAFLDPGGNYYSNQAGSNMRCASGWFDVTFTFCDWYDAQNGYLASGPANPGVDRYYSETWLVRDAVVATPEPASVALLATGLVGIVGIARRRKA